MPLARLLSTLNLTAALAVIGVLEVGYHRTLGRMMLPHAAFSASANRFMMALGAYVGHLVGILGLLVVLNALLSRENRRLLFPRPIQISLIFIAAVFFFMATRGIVSQLGQRPMLHLQISHAFLMFFIFVGLWYRSEHENPPARVRLAAAMFTLPGILHAVAVFLDRVRDIASPSALAALDRTGEILSLLAALLSPLLLVHSTARGWRRTVAIAVGVATLASTGSALEWRFDFLQALTMHGLGLQLPSPLATGPQLYGAFFVLSLSSAALTCTALLLTPGAHRLMGWGIMLVVAAGYQAVTPASMLMSLAGLFALAVGAKRVGQPDQPEGETEDRRLPEQDLIMNSAPSSGTTM